MIITQLTGGLGNQMFQYAMGRAVAEHLKVEFKLDVIVYKKHKKRQYSLDNFNIIAKIATPLDIITRKYLPWRKIIKEKRWDFIPEALNLPDNSYINSYLDNYWYVWQSEKYFKDIENIIKKEFTLKKSLPDSSNELQDLIENSNSVSIHVRRGDYTEPKHKAIFTSCTEEYYRRAISTISSKVDSPRFFVFSDDLEWCRTLPLPKDTVFVGSEFGLKDYEELVIMSKCKHNIIANSSFSWWGAWLNNNASKIVISPKRWHIKTDVNEKDLIPKTWSKI